MCIFTLNIEKKEKSTAIYFLKFADLIEILQQMIFALWALQTDVDSLSYNSALYYVRIICFVIARKICIISSF